MKRITNLSALVCLTLLAISCVKELSNEVQGDEAQSVAFVIKDFVPEKQTKTALQLSTLKYQWSADDIVGIFPSSGYQAIFPMESGAGSSSAVFDGGGWGLKSDATYYAYYPFSRENFESEDMKENVKYTYEGQVAVFAENDFADLSKYNYMASGASTVKNGRVTFNFKNLGALCRLSFKAPASATYSELIISSDNAVFPISGYFDATDKDNDGEINLVCNSDLRNYIEILFPESHQNFTEGDLVEFYFFLPPVDLSSEAINIKLIDMYYNVYNLSFAGKNIQAGKAYEFNDNDNSWTDDSEAGGGSNTGIYLGIMGFNQQLYSYPVNELTADNKAGFDTFIDGLEMKNGTLLYYSVDQAVTKMQQTKFPDDLYNVAFVTFTDGLDQGSMMMNFDYETDEAYLAAINSRLTHEKVSGRDISAYSIGVRGSDVTDVNKFHNNLEQLASVPDDSYEVSSMDELNAIFQEIAGQLEQTSYVQKLSITIPGQANGTIVRFSFDDITSAGNSKQYIQGVFDLKTRSLKDVTYHGLKSTSGTTVQGKVDGIFVTFTFDGISTDNKVLISQENIKQWSYITSTSSWQINSEFDKDQNAEILNEKRSMAVMLVLDCSSSLSSDFDKLKTSAKSFVEALCPSVQDDDQNSDSIYSTTPFNGALAMEKEGIKYYLSKYGYNSAGGVPYGYTALGVTVVTDNQSFYVALNDYYSHTVSNNYYRTDIENHAPSVEIAEIIIENFEEINTSLKRFGGTELDPVKGYWTNYADNQLAFLGAEYVSYYYFNVDNTYTARVNSEMTLRGVYEIL